MELIVASGMGTKIEYSINVLTSNHLAVGGVDVWEHYHQNKGWQTNNRHRTGINKLGGPIMDRMLDRTNIESIRKTMQMHEDIFKHQVRELHRVYSVQKMLMDELKSEIRQQKLWNPMNDTDTLSHTHHCIERQQNHTAAQTSSYGLEFYVQSLREDLIGSRERSGNCSRDTTIIKKMQRGFDLEKPAEEEILTRARGFDEGHEAGPSTGGDTNEEMEVDLTLSIGGSSQVKNLHQHQLACSDRVGECSGSDTTTPMTMSNSTVTFTQETKGPHWLSHGLQLK